MTPKEYLKQYADNKIMIKIKRREISMLLHTLELAATDYTKERVQSSPSDRMAAVVAKAADMQAELEGDIDRLIELQKEIVDVINTVSNTKYRELLIMRYIEGLKWEEIAEQFHFKDARQIYRLHGYALLCIKINESA